MSAVLHRSCRFRSKLFTVGLRRISSSFSSALISQNENLISYQNAANFKTLASIRSFQSKPRNFSSAASNSPDSQIAPPGTVKRDLSPLANETRQVLDDTMRTIYGLSRVTAALGVVQFGIGGWWVYYYCTEKPPLTTEVSAAAASCAVAVAFSMCLAFILRRRLRPMFFERKMEEEGRMQILKLNLQVAKSMNLLFVRLRLRE